MIESCGRKALKAPAPSVVICKAPEDTASIMSLPEPSWLLGKIWMSMRPLVFSLTSLAIRSAICTCGWVVASDSPQRIVVVCARSRRGPARPAPNAAAPVMNWRLVIFAFTVSPQEIIYTLASSEPIARYPLRTVCNSVLSSRLSGARTLSQPSSPVCSASMVL